MKGQAAPLPRRGTGLSWERSARTPYFLLRARRRGFAKARIGVVVAKAVHKSAVKRNFLRRQARAVLETLAAEGFELLLTVSPGARSLTKEAFRAEVMKVAASLHKKQ